MKGRGIVMQIEMKIWEALGVEGRTLLYCQIMDDQMLNLGDKGKSMISPPMVFSPDKSIYVEVSLKETPEEMEGGSQ